MPLDVEYLAEAVDEAEGAVRWYAERSVMAAIGFDAELEASELAISDNPLAWPVFEAPTRRLLLRRFPFSVVYYLEAHRAVIVAVAHAHRRPGYWRYRLESRGRQ